MTVSFGQRFRAALRAFQEPQVVMNLMEPEKFDAYGNRLMRYQILWSMYENSSYRHLHKWAVKYKADHGLYKYVRGVYNPMYRLVEFHVAHIWGGLLDRGATDDLGYALPIETENPDLRPAIARLWEWSNWQVKKDITVRYGAAMGDVAIRVKDDPVKGRVYLDVVHPLTLADLTLDDWGNVKGYVIEEMRPDPRPSRPEDALVAYQEVAERGGENVVYTTYLDGEPYAWNGVAATWRVPYTFVPMVFIKHVDVGGGWGWSEAHAQRTKIHELDDLASMMHDHIRKTVNPIWLFSGVSKMADNPSMTPDRESIPALYGTEGAKAQALATMLDLNAVGGRVQKLIEELERDFPELRLDAHREMVGKVSGRALREARAESTEKILQRRPAYDDALRRVQQMAVAIGGWRGYGPEFAGFGLDSYRAGQMDHNIRNRAVFPPDPIDDYEIEEALWRAAAMAASAGVPLEVFLTRLEWTEEEIQFALQKRAEEMEQRAELSMASNQGSGIGLLLDMGRDMNGGRPPQPEEAPADR